MMEFNNKRVEGKKSETHLFSIADFFCIMHFKQTIKA
jgi:hypothetical protein